MRSHCRVFNPLGWWQEEDPEKAGRRLLVIGCGPSGIQILRQLWKDFEVTLVEPKDYYEFTPGILRGLCHPQHLETLLLPLEDALAGMRVNHIKGRVVRLSERSAQVDSPVHGLMAVDFDYAVVAVGSQYAGNSLWKVSGAAEADELSLIGRRKSLEAMRQNLEDLEKEQKTLVLLGAGLVGVELAAEVKHYFPTLRVVLADRSQTVLPVLPKDAQDYAQTWLKEHGVDLRLGCELPRDETALLKALEIDEAKVLLCAGLGFHAGMAATLECVDASGQITTNRFMQCIDSKGHPSADGRIFALGDCVNVRGTEMRFTKDIYPAEAMANVVVSNLRRLRNDPGSANLEELSSRLQEITLCSLGPTDCIFVRNGGVVTTGWIAVQMKHQVEVTKMGEMRQEMWGSFVWSLVPHW